MTLTRLTAIALVIVIAGVGLGATYARDAGAAEEVGVAAVPDPPWNVSCNLYPPYYEHNEVNVWHSTGATYYPVYRALSLGGAKSPVGNATGESEYVNIYTDYGVDTYQVYYYWAKACNASGCSALSSSYAACQLNTYAAPGNVQASDGTSSVYVRVTYNLASGPSKYAVYRAASAGGAYSFVNWDWNGSYDDTEATPGVLQYYKVRSCTGLDQCGPYSSYDSGHRKLAAPAWIQASNGNYNGYVPVDWPNVNNATSYTLYRGTNTQGYDTTWSGLTGSSYDDHTVVGTSHYYYWAQACNSLSCSGLTGPDEGWAGEPPPAPTNVSASNNLTNRIWVDWSATGDATFFEVWRSASQASGYIKVSDPDPTVSEWNDYSASPGVPYWYKIKACKWLGCSELSAAASGLRVGPPAPPANVQASDDAYTDKVRVTWSTAAGAQAYKVYRHTVNSSGAATHIGTVVSTSYDDISAVPGTVYYYWVTSWSSSTGEGEFSVSDTGRRAEASTATPTRTPTATSTNTPRPTYTPTPTMTGRPTGSSTATDTPRQTYTPTPTMTRRPIGSSTPTSTRIPGMTRSVLLPLVTK